MKKSFLFLAEGFEEVEALAVVDVLRRGNVDVETVSVSEGLEVVGAHGIPVKADRLLKDVVGGEADFLILPGGLPGAQNLADCRELTGWLQRHFDLGGNVAAICAAPALVLGNLKMDRKYKMTCYPGFDAYLEGAEYTGNMVEIADNFILGKGPGAASAFGFAILEKFAGAEKAQEVKSGMLMA